MEVKTTETHIVSRAILWYKQLNVNVEHSKLEMLIHKIPFPDSVYRIPRRIRWLVRLESIGFVVRDKDPSLFVGKLLSNIAIYGTVVVVFSHKIDSGKVQGKATI